jgi:hypothetical protein
MNYKTAYMDVLSGLTNDVKSLTVSPCTNLHTHTFSVSQVALLVSFDRYILPHVREP